MDRVIDPSSHHIVIFHYDLSTESSEHDMITMTKCYYIHGEYKNSPEKPVFGMYDYG